MKFSKITFILFILSVCAFHTQSQDLKGTTGKSWQPSFDDMKPYLSPQMQEEIKNATPERVAIMKAQYEHHILLSFYPDGTLHQDMSEISKTGTWSSNSKTGTWSLSSDGKTLTSKIKDKTGKITTISGKITLTADKLTFEADPKSKTPPMIFVPTDF